MEDESVLACSRRKRNQRSLGTEVLDKQEALASLRKRLIMTLIMA